MSEKDSTQTEKLETALREMDALLEKILHIQFGIQDEEWLDAIKTIEDGYAKAITYIKNHSSSIT